MREQAESVRRGIDVQVAVNPVAAAEASSAAG
jgi:hypothetical protein